MNRRIAISVWIEENKDFLAQDLDNIKALINVFKPLAESVEVFTNVETLSLDDVVVTLFPEMIDTEVKSKNFIIDIYKAKGFSSKLHVVSYGIELLKDPTQFINDIENLMDKLDINSWLSTVTDRCNYLYNKYVPRLRIPIDAEMEGWKEKLKIDEVCFCSHSNVQWMIFDIGKGDKDELHFNDEFVIPMYWIIEYLARRRNTHPKSMYFMNEYVTCTSEYGVFRNRSTIKNSSDETLKIAQISGSEYAKKMNEQFRKDDEKFREMKVDHHPDNNLDVVLESTYLKLKNKFEQN